MDQEQRTGLQIMECDRKGGIMDIAGEKLKQLQGRVFHAVADNNRILQYRISHDGKLILEKTIKSLHLENLKATSTRFLVTAKDKSKRRWRKVVTGDPDKRIRDHMKEIPQVKFVDKVSFTLGVIVIVLSEWIALRMPSVFPKFYFAIMALLLLWRYISYKAEKYQYFMLDFCYFVNASVVLQYFLAPGNHLWFKANYALVLGPVCLGIVVWRNSLVFHSLDKVTSFFLHALPPMSLHLTRWEFIPELTASMTVGGDVSSFTAFEIFFFPLILYCVWQVGYLFITEYLLVQQFDDDPELITALRYLTQDHKNSRNKSLHAFLRKYGVIRDDEFLDLATIKGKAIFVTIQLIYTVITILHIPLLYNSYALSGIYLASVFTWGTWNGASFYIEVFSKRYNAQFESRQTIMENSPAKTVSEDGTQTNCDEEEGDFEEEEEVRDRTMTLTDDMAEEIYSALSGLDAASAPLPVGAKHHAE